MIGPSLNHYQITARIGVGGMVAIKVLLANTFP
jgi:hypothetical protein